jgi:hypothetical protein
VKKINDIQEDESTNISTVRINPEYSRLVSPLSNQEHEMLKDSIKKDGLYYPMIVNSNEEILMAIIDPEYPKN